MSRTSKGVTLKQREGVWYITWSEGGRSYRRSTGTRNRKEADAALGAFLHERANPSRSYDVVSVKVVVEAYIKENECAAPERNEYAAKHLCEFFGDMSVVDLERKDSREYRKWRQDRGVKDGTIRRELACLIAAINHAAAEKRLAKADIPTIDLPPMPPPKDRWLTRDEAGALIQASRFAVVRDESGRFLPPTEQELTRCYLFVMIALYTGARKGVIERLKWTQVDLVAGRINFNTPGRAQTTKRRPVVPISDVLLPILTAAQAVATTEYVLEGGGAIRSAFESAVERAGLGAVTPHTLRHTWATWAAQAGVDMWQIAGVLGDTEATVRKTYAHHHPDYLKNAINAASVSKSISNSVSSISSVSKKA